MRTFRIFFVLALAALTFLPCAAKTNSVKTKSVAIGCFINESEFGRGDKDNHIITYYAKSALLSKLSESSFLRIIECNDINVLVNEAGTGVNRSGADYIVLGTITEYGRRVSKNATSRTEVGQKSLIPTRTHSVEAGVSIKVVDATTGDIIYSDFSTGSAEGESIMAIGIGEEAFADALSPLIENIIVKCIQDPWKTRILQVEENQFVIAGGHQNGICERDEFDVYQKSYTVGTPDKIVGSAIAIMSVSDDLGNEYTYCRYKGESISSEYLAGYYVADRP